MRLNEKKVFFLIFLLLVVILPFIPIKSGFLKNKIEQTLTSFGFKTTLESASFKFPLKIILEGVVVEDENLNLKVTQATISLSPLKFLLRKPPIHLRLKSPFLSLKKIPTLDIAQKSTRPFPLESVTVENGTFLYSAFFIKNINGEVALRNDRVEGQIMAMHNSSRILCSISRRQSESIVDIKVNEIKLSEYFPIDLAVVGKMNIKTIISADAILSQMTATFGESKFTGEGRYSKDGFSMDIDWQRRGIFSSGKLSVFGVNGEAKFEVISEGSYLAGTSSFLHDKIMFKITTATVCLPDVEGVLHLRLDGEVKSDSYLIVSSITGNIKTDKNYTVSSDLLLSEKSIILKGSINPGISSFDFSVKDSQLNALITGQKKSRISVSGTVSPLRLDVKSDGWQLDDIPFVTFPFSGTLETTGEFTYRKKAWLFKSYNTLKNIYMDGLKFGDITAKVVITPYMFSIDGLNYLSGKITGTYKNLYGIRREVDFTATEAPAGLLPWIFGPATKKVSGVLTGQVKILQEGGNVDGIIRTNVSKLKIGESDIGDVMLSVTFERGQVSTDKFLIKNKFGQIAGGISVLDQKVTGLLNFNTYSVDGKTPLTGRVDVSGSFYDFNDYKIEFQSDAFSIGRFLSKSPMRFFLISDRNAIKITDVELGDLKDTNISIAKDKPNRIDGKFNLKNFSLSVIDSKLSGQLSISGNITGTLSRPVVDSSFNVQDFLYQDFFPSGSVRGKFRYENQAASIQDTVWEIAGGKVNVKGILAKESSIIADVYLPDVSKISPTPVIRSGELRASVVVKDRTANFAKPKITTIGELKNFNLSQQMFKKLVFNANYEKNKVFFNKLSLQFDGNEVSLSEKSVLSLDRKNFDIRLVVNNFKYGIISVLGRINLTGTYQLNPTKLNGKIVLADFWIGEEKFSGDIFKFDVGEKNLSIKYDSKEILPKFSLEARFDSKSFIMDYAGRRRETLTVSGKYDPAALNISLRTTELSLEPVAGLFNLPFSVSGDADIKAHLAGPIFEPKLDVSASIKNGRLFGIPFNEILGDLTLRENILSLPKFSITKTDVYKIVANGSVPVAVAKKSVKKIAHLPNNLSITIEYGKLNLLEGVAIFKKAQGPVMGKIDLKGTYASPKLTGFLKIENADLELTRYLAKVNNFNLIAILKDNELVLENFSGRSGIGRFLLRGTALIENFALSRINFSFENTTTSGIDLFIPELPIPSPFSKETGIKFASTYSYGKPKFKINLTGDAREKVILSGWVVLNDTYFSYPAPHDKGEDVLRDILKKVELDLQLRSGENTWYENELVSINIDGHLNIKGNWYKPSVSGLVESKRGYISYLGTEFKVKTARLEIINDEPYLEGTATKTIQTPQGSDTVELIINRATIGKLQPRFVSLENPHLSSEKVLMRVIGGDIEYSTPQERDILLRQGLVRLLDSSLATPLAKNLLRRSGLVDLLKVSYEYPSVAKDKTLDTATLPELLKGTKYSFEKYLTDSMLLGYGLILDEKLGKLDLKHEIEVAYRWHGNIFIRGVYEIGSRDMLRPPDRRVTIEQRWRFGWPEKKERK